MHAEELACNTILQKIPQSEQRKGSSRNLSSTYLPHVSQSRTSLWHMHLIAHGNSIDKDPSLLTFVEKENINTI